eukprot:4968598-Pyramimonas_sp.AAC.1
MHSPTMGWRWAIESSIAQHRSPVRNGSEPDQQRRRAPALNPMVAQALGQPRAVIFGGKATAEE